jgi:hypothetical protein
MKRRLGTYYLGATIADVRVLAKVRHASIRAKIALGMYEDDEILRECHMTLVPPFHTTYGEATALNLRCAQAQLICNHPLISSQFELGKMMTMIFNASNVLHFQITVCGTPHEVGSFYNYVEALRHRIVNCEKFNWRGSMPPLFHPHITALNLKDSTLLQPHATRAGMDVLWNTAIDELTRENNALSTKLRFKVAYPTLYAKYEKGWEPLSKNPETTM